MRIFVDALAAGEHAIDGDEHHYLSRVRRARPGDAIELVDGRGQLGRAEILRIAERETIVRVAAIERAVEPPPRVRVLVPPIKGDRMDACIEKLVEVGVDDLIVWPAQRAVVRIDDAKRAARVEHYGAVAKAAARQSRRATVPGVQIVGSLAAAIAGLPTSGARVVLDPNAPRAAFPIDDHLAIASGPEGGLAPEELDALAAAGFLSIGLGPRVLRADTAPVVAVALVRAATAS